MDKETAKDLRGLVDSFQGSIKLRAVLYTIVDELEATGDEESNSPQQQWPPAGMAIQVKDDKDWMAATSRGNGWFDWADGTSKHVLPLESVEWRYLPAPKVCPEWAQCWVGTSAGEYQFLAYTPRVGDAFLNKSHTFIHVESRPEGK